MTLYVNGEQVDPIRIEQEKERMRPDYEKAFADQPPQERETQLSEWARENVIEAVLFHQAADRNSPEITDSAVNSFIDQMLSREEESGPIHQRLSSSQEERQKLRQEIADQIRIEQLIQQIAADVLAPKDKDIRRYYERNVQRFTVPEMVRAAHIVKHPHPDIPSEQQKQEMQDILNRIQCGSDFTQLAKENSACPENGGDLGYFARGQMVPAFEEVVFALKPGQVSDVFATEFGWHIAKVLDRRPAVPCPLDQVRQLIIKELTQQSRDRAVEQFLDREREKAVIEDR